MMVPFQRNYDADKTLVKDPDRTSKLLAEFEGVLAWLVRGALEYQQEGLNEPNKTKQARDEYRDEMDLLKDWISECCEVGDPESVSELSSNLWASWHEYAAKKGELRYIPTARSLGRRLSSKFKTAKGANGARKMLGIRVRVSADSDLFEDESIK